MFKLKLPQAFFNQLCISAVFSSDLDQIIDYRQFQFNEHCACQHTSTSTSTNPGKRGEDNTHVTYVVSGFVKFPCMGHVYSVNPPSMPPITHGRGEVGQYIDRCITNLVLTAQSLIRSFSMHSLSCSSTSA